jgi:BBSome-interacting protein 1
MSSLDESNDQKASDEMENSSSKPKDIVGKEQQQPSLSSSVSMPTPTMAFREMLPKQGYLHCEDELTFVLCKPKLLPLKSFTMEKLEKIQTESVEKAKELMENNLLD